MLMVCAKFVISFVSCKKYYTFVPEKTMKRIILPFCLLLAAVFPHAFPASAASSLPEVENDSLRVDTLREIEVRPDSMLRVNDAIRQSIGREKEGRIGYPSVSDVIGAKVTDRIMHPFAVKERKREKKHARDRKILEEYDQINRVKTFEELLDEAIRKQAIEDGLNPPTRTGKK